MAALIRAYDWAGTPLGPIESWPPTLKAVTSLILRSPVPLVTLWGTLGIMIYNDGYSQFAGKRHPRLLGSEVRKGWPEVADWNDNVMKVGLAGGTLSYRDQLLVLFRHGTPEDVWLDLDYSPITDENGAHVGVICIVSEITARVTAERQRFAEQERQRALLTQMPGFAAVLTGPDHVYEYVNQAYREIGGHRDFLGKTVREAFPELVGQGIYELLDNVYATGKRYVARGLPLFLAGENRFVDFVYEPVRDEKGAVTGIFVGGYDSTEAYRAAQTVRENEARLRLMDRLNAVFRDTENPEELAFTAASLLGEALGASRAGYGAIDAATDTVNLTRNFISAGTRNLTGVVAMREFGSFIDDLKRGQTVVISDVRVDPRTRDHAQKLEGVHARALVNVPVMEQGVVVAMLYVNSAGQRDWAEDEVVFIREVAERIRIAIERRRAEAALREGEKRLRLLDGLNQVFRDSENPDDIAYAAAQMLGQALDVSRAGYGFIDKEAETITIRRDWNAPGIRSLAGTLHFRDYGSYIEDLKRGETVVISDVGQDERTRNGAVELRNISAASFINMPVTEQGGIVALLYLNNATPRDWSDEEVAFVREVADRTRTAVERRRAEAAVRQNEARLQFLDALARETAVQTDADAILAVTTRMLAQHMGVSICAYADMDADGDHFTIRGDWAAPGSSSIVGYYSLRDFGRLAVERLGAGLPLVINDNRAELPPEEAATFQSIGIGATVCMPLVKEGRLTALMAVHHKDPHAWTRGEQALLGEVVERSWAHIERVRAEANLRRQGEMLLLATGAAAIGTWDYDPQSGVLTWDAQTKALFGLPADAQVSYEGSFLAGLHPEDRARTHDAVMAALEPDGSGSYDVEYRTIGLQDGVERWIAASGRGFFADGKPVRFVGTVHDISAQKNAERILRRSESQFRTMAQAMPNHVWTATPDGLLDWLNDQVYAYSGAPTGSLIGAAWTAIVHPDDLPHAGENWAASLASGRIYQAEFRLRRADGTFRWHIARAVPVRDDSGQIIRWIGTNTDIDDQKNAEVLLERRLRERTAALVKAEQALLQAQKMEAIGNLTGGIAHDFNNLLMAVSGSLELLKKRLPADPMIGRLIDNAMEGARRGASLTRRMLAFARRQPLQPERLDLRTLTAGMTELLERSLGPMVAVETRFPGDLPLVETDPNQLESALLNLVVNARDAMQGEGRIIIAARAETVGADAALPPGAYVCLSVSDTGEGMDAETLKRATEPFFTTKGVGKGTGLGLSMVHGLAEQSGGALVLKSEKGKGTVAEIWLPAAPAQGAPAAVRAPQPAAAMPVEAMTILAVDDDALVLMNTADMLEDMGHTVAAVGSGADALSLLEKGHRFDLVITDHAMPQMTGAQLAQEIRRRHPALKVLLATGYAELPADADIGLPSLAKPFTQAELAAALARLK